MNIVDTVKKRKVVAPNDFASLQVVADGFERHYDQIATPSQRPLAQLFLLIRRGILARVAAVEISGLRARVFSFWGLLDVQSPDGDAGGFKGGLEVVKTVAEQARGPVARRFKGRRHHAVLHVNGDVHVSQLGRIQTDLHRPTIGE